MNEWTKEQHLELGMQYLQMAVTHIGYAGYKFPDKLELILKKKDNYEKSTCTVFDDSNGVYA